MLNYLFLKKGKILRGYQSSTLLRVDFIDAPKVESSLGVGQVFCEKKIKKLFFKGNDALKLGKQSKFTLFYRSLKSVCS